MSVPKVEQLERALDVLAIAADRYGEVYLPLYLMVEEEHAAALLRREAVARACLRATAVRARPGGPYGRFARR